MADQDSAFSIAAGVIGVLSLVLQLVTLFFAILAGIYARWLWLAERISPTQILELTYILQSQYNETERMAKSLNNLTLVDNAYLEDLKRLFISMFETEIEIGRCLLRSKGRLNRIRLWHDLQALRRKTEGDMQVLRNEHFDARLTVISQYAASFFSVQAHRF